jgi:hypothetical protein
MAGIEFSALSRQCLDQRLPDIDTLAKNVAAWVAKRNRNNVHIRWQFTTRQARDTMARCYPPQSVG